MPPSPADRFEDLVDVFEHDHLRLARMLDNIDGLCRGRAFQDAAKVFGEFRALLELHTSNEELALDRLTNDHHCPPELRERLRGQHVTLNDCLTKVAATISQNEYDAFVTETAALSRALLEHNHDETTLLLPALFSSVNQAAC